MTQAYEDIVAQLDESTNPIIRYKLNRYVHGVDPENAEMLRLRESIKRSAIAEGLVQDLVTSDPAERQGMSQIYLTFRYLADIDYPPGDKSHDFMAGLHILTRSGHVQDPRCERALDLLASKVIDGQGWAMERKLFSHTKGKGDFTHAKWEKETLGNASLFLTVDALEILNTAGRLT
jgi:hypothetical protein